MDNSTFLWIRSEDPHKILVRAVYKSQDGFDLYGLRPELFDKIMTWCNENKCCRRTAYNEFVFEEEKDLTFFLLKWSSC